MKTRKLLGICMDHSTAHLMEFKNNTISSVTITSESLQDDDEINWKDESLIQNKEQNNLSSYFSELISVIKNFDEVLLFGPTEAKSELFNQIDSIHHLDMIKITMKTTDKLTEKQMQTFVREFFTQQVHPTKKIRNRTFFFF